MAFFGLLKKKKKFCEETPQTNDNRTMEMIDPSKQDPILQMMANIPEGNEQVAMKTYDIVVFEPNPDGTKKQTVVNGVKAHSAKELAGLYAADGAQIQILKEYGSEGNVHIPQQPKQQPRQPIAPQANSLSNSEKIANHPVDPAFKAFKEPAKYFEIGGVKCKLENGKMYQEQWVRVDSSKYRLIADATNKLVSMNGKHLETLKWVQIENNDEEGEIENA